MKPWFPILLLVGSVFGGLNAFACVEPHFSKQTFNVRGVAFDATGEVAYIEELRHSPGEDGGHLAVNYFRPDGKPLAVKQVDYGCRPFAPGFLLLDLTSGELEGVTWKQDGASSHHSGKTRPLELPAGDYLIDAGFDNYVKSRWERLALGEALKFQYLLPGQGRFITLRVEPSEPPSELGQELESRAQGDTTFFRISANNRLLRLITPDIYLGYSQDSRTLQYFMGPSNLPMMSDLDKVLIRYENLDGYRQDLARETMITTPDT